MFRHATRLVAAALVLGAAAPASAAAPEIVFKLNGKAVTAVPVDRLGALSVTVSPGGTFKAAYAGQWSGLDQAINLVGKAFDEGGDAPDVADSGAWYGSAIGMTSQDTAWGDKPALTGSMNAVARDLELYRAKTDDDLVFTMRFRRKVYTGKTVWVNNGWVQETRWETVGPALGQAVLKLEPPTFAKDLKVQELAGRAQPTKDKLDMMARTLLYPTSYGGRTVTFDGSQVTGVEPAGAPVYNWNYEGATQTVWAHVPVKIKLKAQMQTRLENLPIPTTSGADFTCPSTLTVKRVVGKGDWQVQELEINDDFRKEARTADGKTADEVVGAGGSPADQIQNLFKGFGR